MMAIAGEANQIFRPVTMFDHGIDGEVEFKDNDGKDSGKRIRAGWSGVGSPSSGPPGRGLLWGFCRWHGRGKRIASAYSRVV